MGGVGGGRGGGGGGGVGGGGGGVWLVELLVLVPPRSRGKVTYSSVGPRTEGSRRHAHRREPSEDKCLLLYLGLKLKTRTT